MATASTFKVEEKFAAAQPSQISMTWKRFRKHKLGLVGLITLTVVVLACILQPIISPFQFDGIDTARQYQPMWSTDAAGHVNILGTDSLGRDNLTRLFYAGRISLSAGLITTAVVTILGIIVGALAGFYGGWVDTLLMRFVDLLLSLPDLPILLIISSMLSESKVVENLLGPTIGTMATIILVLSLLGWLGISRLVRGSILSLRSLDFIEASRALGGSSRRIIMRHLLPNSLAPLIVSSTLSVGGFIIVESALSFLGVGIQPPTPSWGNLLQGSSQYGWFINDLNPFHEIRFYLVLFPGIMILLTVLSINFIGDALRDALDPRLKT